MTGGLASTADLRRSDLCQYVDCIEHLWIITWTLGDHSRQCNFIQGVFNQILINFLGSVKVTHHLQMNIRYFDPVRNLWLYNLNIKNQLSTKLWNWVDIIFQVYQGARHNEITWIWLFLMTSTRFDDDVMGITLLYFNRFCC